MISAPVRISVEHVTKRFASGAVTVFEDLDLAVRDGEALSILGPSGCGKTTLLRCMHGLADIDGGRIVIDGVEVRAPSRKVAMVFQHFGLMPWKRVSENVAYGVELAGLERRTIDQRVLRYTNESAIGKQLAVQAGLAFDSGLGEARELMEDMLLWARADGERFKALFDAQIAWANLQRVTGGL